VLIGRLFVGALALPLALLASASLFVGCSESEPAAKNVVVVGTEPTFPPFESKDEKGNFVGFDIDMLRAIGAKAGFEVEFKDLPFDSLIPALNSGQIDAIAAGMSITEDRKKAVDFSEPYFNAGLSLAVQKANATIKSSADLKGKRAAVQQGRPARRRRRSCRPRARWSR
jgi:ABC-type amino acid transport substrate-binding protein